MNEIVKVLELLALNVLMGQWRGYINKRKKKSVICARKKLK